MLATEPQLQEVLAAYAAAKNAHDVEAALEQCTDDCTYESVGVPGRVEGKDSLRAFYNGLYELLPDYHADFTGTTITGDTAIAWGRFGGTVASTGRRVDVPVTFVCTFRDGLIATDVGYFDTRMLYEQAGLPHPADAEAADFVARFAEAWADPDPQAFARLVHDDTRNFYPGMTEEQDGAGVVEYLKNATAAMPGLKIEVLRWTPDGDSVFIEWKGSARPGGELFEWQGCDRFTLRDGRSVSGRAYFDTTPLAAAVAAGTPS